MFKLPLVLVCKKLNRYGDVMTLDCEVTDAEGSQVRNAGSFGITISSSKTLEEVSSILQSYANNLSRDLLTSGKAERDALTTEDNDMKTDTITSLSFVGVTS